MTLHAPPSPAYPDSDPGRRVASLREALMLVRGIAGAPAFADSDALFDEAAAVSVAYDQATPVVRRQFDAMVGETSAWAAAGVEALLAAGDVPPRHPAERLAEELDGALKGLIRLLL